MARKIKNDTEQLILEAATEEFLSKGFDGARTTRIAQAAGVTHAMLHYYFRTKEQLFNHVFTHKFSELSKSFVNILNDTSSDQHIKERIKMAIGAHFDFVASDPRLPIFVIHEMIAHDERVELLKSTIAKIITSMAFSAKADVEKAISAGELATVSFVNLMVDIASLNVFSVVIAKALSSVVGIDQEKFLAIRREENINTIMKRLEV